MNTPSIEEKELSLAALQEAALEWEKETGRLYPHEFLGALAETVEKLVSDWLEAHAAPKRVTELFDDLIMLERCAQGARYNCLNEWEAIWLAQEIPGLTRLIAESGGTFHGPDNESQPRKVAESDKGTGLKDLVLELQKGFEGLEQSIFDYAEKRTAELEQEGRGGPDPLPVAEAEGGIVLAYERLGAAIRLLSDWADQQNGKA